ncbi:MAG: carbohydrate ABC transporter permease [Planctomycetota bacterium]|jgi:multiple sugar transport system permease protein|nr:carbohydrate ABC transporter permease [Planctomycetota bacterium]
MKRSPLANAILWFVLIMGTAAFVFPLWWMAVVSLETPDRAEAAVTGSAGIALFPPNPQPGNYLDAIRETGSTPWMGFVDALSNSIVVTVLVVIGTVLSSSLVGYAFARLRFRGSSPLFLVMLGTMMLPGQVTMIPLFLLFRQFGWIDSILPLVVPAFFGNAFFIFMYRQFIAQIPESLVEAARVDGLGHLAIWWKIMLPLCRPVTAICAVFTFIGTWNDFLAPLIYLHSDENATLAVALNGFKNQYGGLEDVHLLMALSVLTMLPCIILFIAAQKTFVEGLARGAVKG